MNPIIEGTIEGDYYYLKPGDMIRSDDEYNAYSSEDGAGNPIFTSIKTAQEENILPGNALPEGRVLFRRKLKFVPLEDINILENL